MMNLQRFFNFTDISPSMSAERSLFTNNPKNNRLISNVVFKSIDAANT
ncbi:MAG TPA: hypothetical protein VGB44_04530 [Flavobacterium sp.]